MEDVDHHIAEVEQHPPPLRTALAAQRLRAGLDELVLHRLGDREHVALGPSGDQQEGVRERQPPRDVEGDWVERGLVVGSLCRELDQLDRSFGCSSYQKILNT